MTQKNSARHSLQMPPRALSDSIRQIWLAGLGAFATAEQEGSKLFEDLVKEGEKIAKQTQPAVDYSMEEITDPLADTDTQSVPAKDIANGAWDKLEQTIEAHIARVLVRLGVPTDDDVHELSKQLEELTENVKQLNKTD